MLHDSIKDKVRVGIVEKFIEILRAHGKDQILFLTFPKHILIISETKGRYDITVQ